MSRMINSLNSIERMKSKYTMALENAQEQVVPEQQEFSGLAENPQSQSAEVIDKTVSVASVDNTMLSVKNSLGLIVLALGILLSVTLSLKSLMVVHSDKNQTVKLAQIVAKQNKEIKNLETVITRIQTERADGIDKIARDVKLLDKKMASDHQDLAELTKDTDMAGSSLNEMKVNQQQIMNRMKKISEDVELIKARP